MFRKFFQLLIVVIAMFSMAGCSTLSGILGQKNGTTSTDPQNPGMNTADQPVESKLAIGTLKLEGTDQAVTAEQAKTLLPLWKAVKSLSSSDTASADEITSLYTQIQDAMTAEQVQSIKDLNLSPEDMQALMAAYGVEMPQGGPDAQPAEGSDSSSTTTQRGADSGGMPQGGPGGGMPAGGPGGGMPPGGEGGAQPNAQGTPDPSRAGRRGGGGMNTMLLDPLIKLLEERAAS